MRRRGRPWRYPISLVLVALIVLPLIGVGWFAVDQLAVADRARDRADRIDELTFELLELTELRTALLDERNWFTVSIGTVDLGIDRGIILALTGLDVDAELASAQAEVDGAISSLELDRTRSEIDELRQVTEGDLTVVSAAYGRIERRMAERSVSILEELAETIGEMSGAGVLNRSLRIIEDATIARQAIATELTSYFSSQFDFGQGLGAFRRDLVIQNADRRASLERIGDALWEGTRVAAEFERLEADPALSTFDDYVEERIVLSLEEAGDVPLANLLDDLAAVSELFRAGSDSIDAILKLVEAAAADVAEATEALSQSANDEAERALVVVGVVVAGSLLLAAVAGRAVGQPMARLAGSARQLRDGESASARVRPSGPIEVRDAIQALNEAVAHIELAEVQATALAAGDLHNDVLHAAAPGRLGSSLQIAVKTLALSMQEREEFRQRMTHEASHDGLTRLANRNASLSQLSKALSRVERTGDRLAVLFIDLDGFKNVNDQHGHAAGDRVLEVAAERLVAAVRDGDHVGRLGGDEFLVVAEPIADAHAAVELAERLVNQLVAPILIDGEQLSIGASIGVAMDAPGTSASRVLRDADIAVYEAKAAGRGQVRICDENLRLELAEREALEIALRHAIDENELELYYQPVVSSRGHRITSLEALVRWNRPGHGLVMPDEFIPVAERSELVTSLDRWVIGALARQIRAWDGEPWFDGVRVAVNVSARHLGSDSFVDDLLVPLVDHGVVSRVIAEVTESALVDDLEVASVKLELLRSAGMQIAIDDFGTGYTSLAHLRALPIDVLKIDRSFVADPAAGSLVQLIIDTGHLLGARIVAEGIESARLADRLTAMGADELQGYHFSRPLRSSMLGAAGDGRAILAGPAIAETSSAGPLPSGP